MPEPVLLSENDDSVATTRLDVAGQSYGSLLSVIGVIALIALGVSGYLSWVALNSSKVAGCGGGSVFDCNDVINSRWSRWLGIPVSFMALGMYASLLGAVGWAAFATGERTRRIALGLIVIMGLSAGVAAIWFISIQIFVLKHLCTYCLAAHTCGLIISALLLRQKPLGGRAVGYLSLISLAGFAVLASGQLLVKPVTYKVIEHKTLSEGSEEIEAFEFAPPVDDPSPDAADDKSTSHRVHPDGFMVLNSWQQQLMAIADFRNSISCLLVVQDRQIQSAAQKQASSAESVLTSKESTQKNENSNLAATEELKERRFVSVSGGTIKLDVAQWPLAGKQDAKYIFVEMYDYTCDHCRRTHAAIVGAKSALDGNVAVVALPIPLNADCNNAITQTGPRMAESCEISNLAVAVWRVDAMKFEEFHNYLLSTPTVVTYDEAIKKANEIVDAAKLRKVLESNVPKQYIAQHVEIYKRVGTGNVPKLLFPGTSIVGEFTSVENLVDVIKAQLK